MQKFIVRRLLSVIPVLSVVSVVISTLLKIASDSPAAILLNDLVTADDTAKLEEKMGLNRPLVEQYFIWIGNMSHGDFGISMAGGGSVASAVFSHVKPTISPTLYTLIVASVVATSMGMLATKNKGTGINHGVTVLPLVDIPLPGSSFGLFLMLISATKLHLFPVPGYIEVSWGLWPHIKSLTLSAVALGSMNAALMVRMTRSVMLEVLGSDYVRMAKAEGMRNLVIATKHALRNSLITIITMIDQDTVQMPVGAAVIEGLFAIPGLGQLMVNPISRRNYYAIQTIVLLTALFNALINIPVDLLCGVADPRVRVT